jgi:cytoskeleton protein RodZ
MDENLVSNDVPAVEVVAATIGAQLRAMREVKGLSVSDVAAQIRLAPRQIEALEADDMASLPELPFVRGFVRSYAKLLGMDAQPLLAALPDPYANSELHTPVSVELPFNVKQLSVQQSRMWLMAATGIAALAIIFALWNRASPAPHSVSVTSVVEQAIELPIPAESAAAASLPMDAADALAAALVAPIAAQVKAPLPVSSVPATMPLTKAVSGVSANSATSQLSLTFAAESWAEITDMNGKILSSGHHPAGSELNFKSLGPYQIVIGNASSVQLFRRAKLVDLTSYINKSSDVARLTLE